MLNQDSTDDIIDTITSFVSTILELTQCTDHMDVTMNIFIKKLCSHQFSIDIVRIQQLQRIHDRFFKIVKEELSVNDILELETKLLNTAEYSIQNIQKLNDIIDSTP
tara:strand:+ start:1891 stop:2211 length:321 start_codon:yes stop_codon:yes gene_type:complete